MSSPSPQWLAKRQAEEREFADRFSALDDVLLRVDGYIARAEETAAALARMPKGNSSARQREADDLRQLAVIGRHHLENLDRVHLLEAPRAQRRGSR